jgi:hypothetical protein
MAIAGVIEIGWAILFFFRPTRKLALAGMLMGAALITLWIITRIFPAPFGHSPEEIDTAGVVCKILEGAGIAALVGAIFQFAAVHTNKPRFLPLVASVLLTGILLGAGMYQIARASEPLFPSLVAVEEDHHEEEDHDHPAETEPADHSDDE